MDVKNSDANDLPDRLPPAVVARLRAADRRPPPAAPDVDAAVLDAARAFFAAREADRFRRRRPARWAAGVAAAAVVVAALFVVRPLDRLMPYDPADIDRSGRVDILDAFALARRRAEGAPITEAEIDALAASVVALDRTGPGR